MPKIYLYAEILVHIRQLTLYASLQTEKREGTKVDVSTNKRVITVTHDGETQYLYLPTGIKGDAAITFPLLKTTDISARVQIEDEHEWKCSISNEIESPWMADDLSELTQIHCRSCNATILEGNRVSRWKALPSENWAELMDFWFCHKPHNADSAETAAEAKGYSSRSKLAVAPGIGMTDLTAIALHAEDCNNIKAAETQQNPDLTVLRCSRCTRMLGTTDQSEELIRLQKSSISLRNGSIEKILSYPPSIFICTQLLSLIESTALKKFVVHSGLSQDSRSEALLLWVFNPDIYYSCSAFEGNAILSNVSPDKTEQWKEHEKDTGALLNDREVSSSGHDQNDEGARDMRNISDDNPNSDDTSQIYGEPMQSQKLAGRLEGDLHFEVPLRQNTPREPSTNTDPLQTITSTETPLSTNSRRHVSDAADPNPADLDADTSEHVNLVHRAAKIFYRSFTSPTNVQEFLDKHSTTHEELFLPNPSDLAALRETLEQTTAMLPASARIFQDWKVGLLDRYEKHPSGLGVMQENPLARGIQAKDGRVTRWDVGHGAEGLYA